MGSTGLLLAIGLPAAAQQRPVHWLNAGAMPPGAIGSLRLHRGGPLSGYFQPVRIRAPEGARIALAMEDGFGCVAVQRAARRHCRSARCIGSRSPTFRIIPESKSFPRSR